MTEILLYSDLEADQQEYAVTIQRSAVNLKTLIDDVLTFSELQTGRVTLERLPLNLQQIVDDSVERLSRQLQSKSVQIRTSLPANLPDLLGDEKHIRQILKQLCDNAAKFTDPGLVEIALEYSVRDDRPWVKFNVADTGIGIEPNKRQLIFNVFIQADGSLTRKHGGIGLGLTLIQDQITLLGGRLGVESRLARAQTSGSKYRWVCSPLSCFQGLNRVKE